MIALDTNVLVRYLVCDDLEQTAVARELLESLTREAPGFACREVIVELVSVLERAYGCARDEIAAALEDLTATEGLAVEAAEDVAYAAAQYREGDGRFADLMIRAAAQRAGGTLYTFDSKAAKQGGVTLPGAAGNKEAAAPETPGAEGTPCD